MAPRSDKTVSEPQTTGKVGSESRLGADGFGPDGVQWFDCTIIKMDEDGREVMSDNLAPGEVLRSSTTDLYGSVQVGARRDTGDDRLVNRGDRTGRGDRMERGDRADAQNRTHPGDTPKVHDSPRIEPKR